MAWWAWVLIILGGVIGLALFGLIALGISIARAQKRDAPQSLEAAEAAFEAGDIRGALSLLQEAYYVAFSDQYDVVTAKTNLGAVRLLELILQERRRQNLDTPNLETAGLQTKFEQAIRDGGGRVPTDLATAVEHVLAHAPDTLAFDAAEARTRRRGRRRMLPDPAQSSAGAPAVDDTRTLAELEEEILSHPDSEEAFLVYSDWLQAHNDPRGMLITLQHRAASDPANVESANEAQGWMDRHRDRFIGDLARSGLELEWKLGFIRSARVVRPGLQESYTAEELLESLLAHPSARFLHSLELGLLNHEYTWSDSVRVLVAGGTRKSLRRLFLGAFDFPGECQISWASITDTNELWPLLPNLEILIVQAGELSLGTLTLPHLRELEIRTGGLDAATMRMVATSQWPRLRKLHLWTGASQYGAEARLTDLNDIFAGQGLRQLEELGIRNSELTDAVCRTLPTANILPQLKVLDFTHGTMSSDGVAALLAHKDRFAHLELIRVDENCLTVEDVRELHTLGPRISADRQKLASERYVSVGE